MFGSDELLETDDILEIAKMTVSTSIRKNTIRGYIGWRSCDNICMDMHDVPDMCEVALSKKDIWTFLLLQHMYWYQV